MTPRDGHVRVLPLHVANKIAAGEVVERPASVVKELLENALDAGAKKIAITITQGGRKLVAVQDDGCGMTRDDAVLSLERQATSKILDVGDIEEIDTLGFRGEAIPSIASVSRFTLVTRRADSDEGTRVTVNAGTLAEVTAAGCPPGTLVEVRDLFCNVPARRKFLRAYVTEENHVKAVFTVHALAHPAVAFSLVVDGRELYRLAPAASADDRVRELFGEDFLESMLPLCGEKDGDVTVRGYIERPNLNTPTRRDQYVFVNGRPATAPSIAYALREAYPRRPGDIRPAAILFLELPPTQVDVNVHPTKREVRFRDNVAVKRAILTSVETTLGCGSETWGSGDTSSFLRGSGVPPLVSGGTRPYSSISTGRRPLCEAKSIEWCETPFPQTPLPRDVAAGIPAPAPVQVDFIAAPDAHEAKPWAWFKYLATTASGYLLLETDAGLVTLNPIAARERIAFERLLAGTREAPCVSQPLLIPETVPFSPPDFARITAALEALAPMGFHLEEFGRDTFKIDAVPQLLEGLSASTVLATIARDLADGGLRRGSARWREELIARSVARSFAGAKIRLDEENAVRLVEELASCRMPYVSPRGKPVMIFTSSRELNRKFAVE